MKEAHFNSPLFLPRPHLGCSGCGLEEAGLFPQAPGHNSGNLHWLLKVSALYVGEKENEKWQQTKEMWTELC